MRTSALQSRILSNYARKMSYTLGTGPSSSIIFPKHGPFDIRAGYALPSYAESKAINEIRSGLVFQLGVPGLYELDRLHLDVESTINPGLQHTVANLFKKLHDPEFIDSSGLRGDRPEALAQLMGILLNDGRRMPSIRMLRLRFADGTPYETAMEPAYSQGTQVVPPEVARAILPVLAQVVQTGSAARLSGAFKIGDRTLVAGGKTGSGDNRFDSVGRWGQRTASRSVDRTAVFVFYIEDRFFGVITTFVPGKEAAGYGFTSSLPVTILKLMSRDIEALWQPGSASSAKKLALASSSMPSAPQPTAPASVAR
jgi:hypothetical protein